MVDEPVVGDHGVVAEQREVDGLMVMLLRQAHVVGVIDDSQLLAFHIVALARSEGRHRLVGLPLIEKQGQYLNNG